MTSNPHNDEVNADTDLPDDIAALLADASTWEPVSDELQESIVASVLAEVDLFRADPAIGDPGSADSGSADSDWGDSGRVASGTADLDRSGTRPAASTPVSVPSPAAAADAGGTVVAFPSRWKTAALGAAAALLLVAGVFGIARLSATGPDLEIALAGTDLAPAATAIAEITDTPEGTRIVISVKDLPPAAPGTYYQAWLRKDVEVGVSAGTFHLRSGDNSEIELWAGVSADDYPLLTVTLQDEAQTESSGQVVLKALIGE